MDSITHIALGACIGEAFFEKGFGKKGMLWGALAQSIPDIDFLAGLWLDIPSQLLAHRGFTHSFLFAFLIVPYFALLADKIHRPHNIRFRTWILFFSCEVLVHLLLDSLNTYGIGWLEPFNHSRFAFGIIFVADPLFSIIPIISVIILFLLHAHHRKRSFWWKFGLTAPLFYILICFHFKCYIDRLTEKRLNQLKLSYISFHTSPAPLQNALWYVYAKTDSGFVTGYINVFNGGLDLHPTLYKRNDALIKEINNHESLQELIRFSQGNYVLKKRGNEIIFNDIRFGQSYGWENKHSPFVFQYVLTHEVNSRLRIQRGRSMVFHQHHFWSLLRRMVHAS